MHPDDPIPPLLFPLQERSARTWLTQLKKAGRIRAIGPRLFTSVPKADVERIVRANWATIVSQLFPDILLSHRSALEYHPTPENRIYLTGSTNREIHYPGLTLKISRGTPPLPDDITFMNFCASSLPRALLENLTTERQNGEPKNVRPEEIEQRLEQILLTKGEKSLNELRNRAREISQVLHFEKEFKRLDLVIGALLGTHTQRNLKTAQGRARSEGAAYDSTIVQRLELLFAALRHHPFVERIDHSKAVDHFSNKAFFESYFSNYIEGTKFEIDEAESIIFDKIIPIDRPTDAHDITGTFGIVGDPSSMQQVPRDASELEQLLKTRHAILLESRPDARPGRYKDKPNRAGSTSFAHPDYVSGTLNKGFEYYKALPLGIPRAIFMMFLVAEVHPFADGNGRIARIMMNAELYSSRTSTIIIPNVYRDDYLGALRALSRRDRPQPLIKMLINAQAFSSLEFSPYPVILKELQRRQWFQEPSESKILLDDPSSS